MITKSEIEICGSWGSDNPEYAFVVDYPTAVEMEYRRAVYGYTADVLSDLCNTVGIDFKRTYKTAYIKTSVPGLESKNPKTKRDAVNYLLSLADWREMLMTELRTLKPNIIFALGELALNGLTKLRNINKYRGSILNLDTEDPRWNAKVVPLLHPRKAIAQDNLPLVFIVADMRKAKNLLEGNYFPFDENIKLTFPKTAERLARWIEHAKSAPFITVDIETRFYSFISCIGVSADGYEGLSFPFLCKETDVPLNEIQEMIKLFAEFVWSGIPIVNQNIAFDDFHLSKAGIYLKNVVGDTMIAHSVLYPDIERNLGMIVSLNTALTYFKDEGKEATNIYEMMRYNAKDAVATWQAYKNQVVHMRQLKVYNFYKDKLFPCYFPYRRMSHRGILVDEAKRKALKEKYEAIYLSKCLALKSLVGHDVNALSNAQCKKLLYEEMGCPIQYAQNSNGEWAPSTKESSLEELYINHVKDPFKVQVIKTIILIRKLKKCLELIETPISTDNRMRGTFNLAGTSSGRTSGGKWYLPRLEDNKLVLTGHSLQTITKHGFVFDGERYGKDLRTMFVASPGYVLIESDLKQADPHVVTVLAEDLETYALLTKKDFKRNKHGIKDDIHTLTASWILEIPWEEVTPEQRQEEGKHTRNGAAYGLGGTKLAREYLHKPPEYCSELLERFHKRVPNIRQVFHAQVEQVLRSHHRVFVTPYGRRREFFAKFSIEVFEQALSYIPQSTVSDKIKFDILCPLDKAFPEVGFLNETHDSLLAEVPENLVDKYIEAITEFSAKPIDFTKCSIPRDWQLVIPIEIHIGENWGEMHEKT